MKDLHTNNSSFRQPVSKSPRYVWAKALLLPILILVVVGSFAILSGRNRPRPIDWIYVNAVTEKKNVVLPDGSKIVIRKGSSIAYPSDYGKTRRYVQLLGEAYFQVEYRSSMPFSVKTKNQITASTGTSFIVRSNDSAEWIIVSAGQVKLETSNINGEYITVKAGQKAEIIKNKIHLSTSGNSNTFSWVNEQLIFNRTSLKQVAEDIYNLYGVPIYFGPDINPDDITITAQFINQPLSHILDDIASRSTLLIHYVENRVVITLPQEKIPANPNETENKKKPWLHRVFAKGG